MSFAQNLKYIKEKENLTNYRLAKLFGCSQSSLINWLDNGVVPHPKTRQKIADHFGITLAELDGDELPALPKQGAEKETAVPKDDGLNYTDSELLQAYHVADARTKEAIRTLLGIKGE